MTCVGPVTWRGDAQTARDLDNLTAALAVSPATDAFVSAASPGTVWYYQPDVHHATHAEYVMAVADAMKHEYDAIGLVGRENVIAGCDCGFATLGRTQGVHPEVAWAKLAALTEGAALASQRLWA